MSVAVHGDPPRRRLRDGARDAVVSTPAADGHTHCIVFKAISGNGQTSPGPDGHVHQVVELEVLEAKGHTHEISARRCASDHNARGNHPIPRGARDEG